MIKRYLRLVSKLRSFSRLAVIGIDPDGFITAARINKVLGNKLGYFSFEILFNSEVVAHADKTGEKKLVMIKELERKYFRKTDLLLIQDEVRLKAICGENDHQPKKIFFIPVAGIPNMENKPIADKAKFKAEVGIPLDKKVVVFSGSLQEWTGLQKLLAVFEEKWDKRFWLLLHTRIELKKGNLFFDKIEELRAKGLPLSLHNKPFDNMDHLADFLAPCDFGLVSYLPTDHPYVGKNIQEIGLASGKFSLYMMLGLPIIATHCRTYDELLKQYDFGTLVTCIEDIPDRLHLLLEKYDSRAESCRNLYQKHLHPERKMDEMLSFIIGA